MKQVAIDQAFPGRISRTFALGLGVAVAVLLLAGGASLALAGRIFANVNAVAHEHDHVLQLDQIHSAFDDLLFELHQINSTERFEHTADALLMQEEISRLLVEFQKASLDSTAPVQPERAQAILDELHRHGEQGRSVVQRLAARTPQLDGRDLEWLNRASHEVPRLTGELAKFHEARIAGLLRSSRSMVQAVAVLFAVFIAVGIALVGVASRVSNRSISNPLRALADAAREIAEGRLETRVQVGSKNEIGLLSQSFNVMAHQLQAHELELSHAQDALQKRAHEAEALYQIGTDISRPQRLDDVLQTITDKAQELLHGDAAALCLLVPGADDLVLRATSGPAEAFRKADPGAPVISHEYARGYLSVPLRLQDSTVGTICLGTRQDRTFSAGEIELLTALATQAAIAVDRDRLAEELRNLAAVEERERLAREMHDGLAQALGLLHLKLHGALNHVEDAPAIAEALREMVRITQSAYEEVRESIFGLRSSAIRQSGLIPTLAEYVKEFSSQNGITVELEVGEGPFDVLPTASEIQAIRIIQEALTNVRKHARVDRARVHLQRNGRWIRVTVEDDGVGWHREPAYSGRQFGVQAMRERAEGAGGHLEIHTAPGRGTRVMATLPGDRA